MAECVLLAFHVPFRREALGAANLHIIPPAAAVTVQRLFETLFHSPQPWLFPLDDTQWRKAWRAAGYAARRPRRSTAAQLPLFAHDLLDASLA